MNKKILIGLSVVGATAGFWACGDGDVITKGGEDEMVLAAYTLGTDEESTMKDLVKAAMDSCSADPACAARMEGATYVPPESSAEGGDTPTPESSDGNGGSGQGPVSSNSRPVINTSASTTPTGSSGSGGDTPPASSAATVTDLSKADGTCSGTPTSITKGGSVTWTFKPAELDAQAYGAARMTEYLNDKKAYEALVNGSTCEWTLEGAATTSVSGTCGGDGKTVTATYATTSKATHPNGFPTSIKLGDKTISCGAVKVNGKPITGCACTSPTAVEITEDPVATWSVSCPATNETITNYSWSTGDEGASATSTTHTFTAKKQTFAPKVTISTAESDTTVECKSPSVSDKGDPDYNIELTSTITKLEPGDYTITACSGGGQICCSTLDGTEKTITLNGAECKAFAGQGWGSCGGGSCKAGSLSTEYTIQCAGCW